MAWRETARRMPGRKECSRQRTTGANRAVFGCAEPNVLDVACLVTGFLEPTDQGRRQLGTNQEFQFASDRTA